MNQCGQCKQFTKQPKQAKGICSAWEQGTTETSEACNFFFLKTLDKDNHKQAAQ